MTEEYDPCHAMAFDEQMLRRAESGTPSIRIYRWTSQCVTLGRNQQPELALVQPADIAWAHRPTGGGAVLHGDDVTLTMAVPKTYREGGVRAFYRMLASVPIEFLRMAGVDALLAEDSTEVLASRSSAYCFGSTSANDLVGPSGQKVCGTALRLTRRGALMQTSIPVAPARSDPAQIIRAGFASNALPVAVPNVDPVGLPSWLRLVSRLT